MKDSPIGSQFIRHSDNFRRKLAGRDVTRYCIWNQGSKVYRGPGSGIEGWDRQCFFFFFHRIKDQAVLDSSESIKMRFFSCLHGGTVPLSNQATLPGQTSHTYF